jgi:radical SAM protein with 4Fe4S-binding SPASM domain
MIAYAHGSAERTELTTNATALTERTSRALLDSGLDYLRISIYAIGAKRHAAVTGSTIHPAVILGNVKRFSDMRGASVKPFTYAKMVADTPEHEAELLHWYEGIVDEVAVERAMNWDGQRELVHLEAPTRRKEVCPSPFYTLFVNADGAVTCCCVDWSKKTIVGNVHSQSLLEIWNGPAMADFRRMHLERRRCENAACSGCTYPDLYMPDNLDGVH